MKVLSMFFLCKMAVFFCTNQVFADTIFLKSQTDKVEKVVAQNIIVSEVHEPFKEDKIFSIIYYYWNTKKNILEEKYIPQSYLGVGRDIRIEYSSKEQKQNLVSSIQQKGIRARITDVQGIISDIYCLKVNYGRNPGQSALGYPDDDTVLFLEQTSGKTEINLSDIKNIEFVGKTEVKVLMKDNKILQGRWERTSTVFAPPIIFTLELKGIDKDGNKVYKDLIDIAKIEFVKDEFDKIPDSKVSSFNITDKQGVVEEEGSNTDTRQFPVFPSMDEKSEIVVPPKAETENKKPEIPMKARVEIDFPACLKSRTAYYNIEGPVWVFTIKFKELNGVAAKITQKKMQIYATDGSVYGDYSFGDIYDSDIQKIVTLNLSPKGQASYTNWVNSPNCELCGATMVLEYAGQDAKGNSVSCEVRFILQKTIPTPTTTVTPSSITPISTPTLPATPTSTPTPTTTLKRLETGTVIKKGIMEMNGLGELTIKNGQELDAIVALSTIENDTVVAIYIRAGDSFTITGIPNGTYYLYFSLGESWDNNLAKFTKKAKFFRFEDDITFETVRTVMGVQYSCFEVTLYAVVGGTAETESVNEKQFPNLR